MKRLLIATLCASAFALTACDKKPTENTTTAPAAVSLSTNNAADIKSDLTAIETLSASKAQQALDFQSKSVAAMQKGDQGALNEMFKDMEAYVESFNKDLSALPLKSSEADAVRNTMKEGNALGIQLTEAGLSAKPDETKIMALAQRATEIQKTLLTDMQALKTKAATAQ